LLYVLIVIVASVNGGTTKGKEILVKSKS